ncbi:MAG: YkvA family protein [Polyangiales bacterium]
MGDSQAKYLDVFPAWLRSLGDDAENLGKLLSSTQLAEGARQALAGGVNYLFKSLDLVPDGIDDIGYLDDAFVLRIAADHAIAEDVSKLPPEQLRSLNRLAEEADTVKEFLAGQYPRLDAYVRGLRKTAARGRSVQDILHNDAVRTSFLSDLRGFSQAYEAPSFSREEKNLVKLRAFFDAKLPR